MTSSATNNNTAALNLLEEYGVFNDAVKWLQNTVKTFFTYVQKTTIPTITALSTNNEERRIHVEKFVYLYNALLFDYDFWLRGKVELRFHRNETEKTDGENRSSHSNLLEKLRHIAGKKISDQEARNAIERMDLVLQAFSMQQDVLLKLLDTKDLFERAFNDIIITSNSIAVDGFEKQFIVSFVIEREIEVDNNRIKFATQEAYRTHFANLIIIKASKGIQPTMNGTILNCKLLNDKSEKQSSTEMPKKRRLFIVNDEESGEGINHTLEIPSLCERLIYIASVFYLKAICRNLPLPPPRFALPCLQIIRPRIQLSGPNL